MVGVWADLLCCLVGLPLTLALSPEGRGDWVGVASGYALTQVVSWRIAFREQVRSYEEHAYQRQLGASAKLSE